MEDTVTCEICSENFSSGKHDPLMLPCGHTFCRMCLTELKKKNQEFACPSCRRDHNNIDVNNLPVNYKLLTLLTDNTKFKYETCDTHEDELIYWCRMCQLPLCGLCLFPSHPQDHKVVKVKVFLQEKKQILDYKLDAKLQQRQSDINLNKQEIKNTLKALNNLLNVNAKLSKSHEIFNELKLEVKCARSLNDIFILETEINSLKKTEEVTELQEFAGTAKDEATNKIDEVTELLECADIAKDKATDQIDTKESLSDEKPRKTSFCIQNNDGRKGELEWKNGKLFMAAFTNKPSNCDVLLKMPSEVFLELSIKDRYLGTVIILPWYRLRRAQHFAALCIGTFGVSYSGSSFDSVGNLNCPREYIAGGWYLRSHDGVRTCENLMTNLEWDGTATGEVCEGIVMGVPFSNNESRFGICTREDKGGTFRCPFGEVVSGMDVVKAAVKHHPVTEVTISRSGVVSNLNKVT